MNFGTEAVVDAFRHGQKQGFAVGVIATAGAVVFSKMFRLTLKEKFKENKMFFNK